MYGGGAGGGKQTLELCGGCLASGRRLRSASDYWSRQFLHSILKDISVGQREDDSVSLCWECSARLARAVSFAHQVKSCYQTLRDYCAQSSSGPLGTIACPPRLAVCVQSPEDIAPGTAADDTSLFVKTEDDWECTAKEECVKEELETGSVSEPNSPGNSFTLSDDEELKRPAERAEPPARGRKRRSGLKKKKRNKCRTVRLTFEEMMQERQDLSMSDAFLSAEFKCHRCIVTFEDSGAAVRHIKSKHSPEQGAFSCPTCESVFATEAELQCHRARHQRRYACAQCGERHATKRQATQQCCSLSSDSACRSKKLDKSPERTDMKVEGDAENLESAAELGNKESESARSSSFPCDLCAKVFRWKTSLRKHAELHRIQAGEKKTPYCDACRLSFTTTSNLQKHTKTSSKHQIQLKVRNLRELLISEQPEQPCKLDPTSIEEIKSTVKNSLTKFPCPHCDKKFQWKGNLLRHVQSHKARASGELYCAPCDRKFSSIATYQQHMKISKKHVSENEFRYMCSECGNKFSNKTRLKDHVDWEHLKIYTHKCPLCQKVFKSHTSLYLHKQVVHRKHDGDHLCDHCGKPFPNRAKLRSHIVAMHTTEQPYRCKLCPATFSWHSCLSRHVKVVHHKLKTKRRRKNKEDLAPPAPLAPLAPLAPPAGADVA